MEEASSKPPFVSRQDRGRGLQGLGPEGGGQRAGPAFATPHGSFLWGTVLWGLPAAETRAHLGHQPAAEPSALKC